MINQKNNKKSTKYNHSQNTHSQHIANFTVIVLLKIIRIGHSMSGSNHIDSNTFAYRKMTHMIYQKLFITEQRIKKGIKIERKKIKALERIKRMLQQLAHNTETMLVSDTERLQAVLSDLKEASLSKYEKIVLQEIIEYRK